MPAIYFQRQPTWWAGTGTSSDTTAANTWWSQPTTTTGTAVYTTPGLTVKLWIDNESVPEWTHPQYQAGLRIDPALYLLPKLRAQAFRIYAPAIHISREEQERREAERERELYRRALAACDEQEVTRVLRLIETREADAAARQVALRLHQQAVTDRQVVADAAKARANELLLSHLSPEQRASFERNGWFIVEGGQSKTRYRVRSGGNVGNIDVLRGHNEEVTHRLCGHIRDQVPIGDHLLAQKIWLEHAEDDFLRIANRHAVR